VDFHEPAAQPADELASGGVRGDQRADDEDPVMLEPARKKSDASDVCVALGLAEAGLRKEASNQIAVQILDLATGRAHAFADLTGDRRLARSRQTRKPQHRGLPDDISVASLRKSHCWSGHGTNRLLVCFRLFRPDPRVRHEATERGLGLEPVPRCEVPQV